MSNKVFDDLGRRVLDINVSPVDPAVLGLHGSAEQIIPCFSHCLSPGSLSSESVAVLDTLARVDAKVLFDDHGAAEGDRVGACLDALKLLGENGHGVVGAVTNKEGQIDQVMRIGELRNQIKVVVDVGSGVAKGSEQQDALLIGDTFGSALDGVQIDVLDGANIDFDRGMVVEEYGSLVRAPEHLLVC